MNFWYPVERELILASRSPRRTEILRMAKIPHAVHPSCIEETPMEGRPGDIVRHWATLKARDVAKTYPDHPVLGADTMVYEDGVLLGKPRSGQEAFDMIRQLSGNWHTVYGGVALVWHSRGLFFSFSEATRVKFRSLEDREIQAYVDSGEPMDKAGAYGIQGLGCVLVEKIEGCYFNVMGLPISRFIHRFLDSLN